jgi:hypothetical protein
MTPERYDQLMNQWPSVKLTLGELKLGWHFCPEWDGLLIGPNMEEMKACSCFRKTCPTCED